MTIRQEIHSFIDDMPESKLIALKPLLYTLVNDAIVIEKNLTGEELHLVAKGMAMYEANPDSFISLENVG
ncbi:MAG: hypothetical protein FWB80_12635 [Defluviitaleaceae bacterium]|nr:hypothetical protein [Defluviitaleaceae bacterium]